MATCTTTSGPYRCSKEVDANGRHAGDCEVDEPPPRTIGPYRDNYRARAYLRGMLDVLTGSALATIGIRLGIPPRTGEPDQTYRTRIWSSR